MTAEIFSFSRLQNLEHYLFAKNVLTLCRTANIAKLNPKLPELEKAIEMEDLALNPPVANELTPQVIALDEERDRAYQALMSRVRSYAFDEDSQLRNAAARIEDVAARYGNVIRMNYDKETGGLKNLLADLAETEAAKALKVLHAEGAVKRLGDHNKAFDEAFRGRFAGDKKLFDMKALRRVTDKAIDAVVRRIDSLDDLEPSAAITALINRYNQLVDNRHTLLKQRETTNAKANAAKIEEQRKMLTPLFDDFAKTLGVAAEAVHYSGENRGSGTAKCYRLTIDGRATSVWAKVSRKKLVEVAEKDLPKASSNKKHGAADNSHGSHANGENPSAEHGSATVTPKS